MISLFNKLTVFFRKLFRKNHNQLVDNSNLNKQDERLESIKLREKAIAERELKLRDGFNKLRKYRDSLISLKNKYEKEKKLTEEKFNIAKKEAAHSDTLSKQYKLEILSLNEKNELIQVDLNNQKEIIEQLLEAKSNEEQSQKTDILEKEALKKLIRDLQNENEKLQKTIRENIESKKHLIMCLELARVGLVDQKQPTNDFQEESKDENNNVDTSKEELKSSTREETDNFEITSEQVISEENFAADYTDIDSISKEISKEFDFGQPSIPEEKSRKEKSYIMEPERRAGRIRIIEPVESVIKGSTDEKVENYKLKIVCWKDEWIWKIGVELPDDLIDNPDVKVFQNNIPLRQDERRENYFNLNLISGRIQIDSPDTNISDLDLTNESYLVFKLNAGNLNEGILVKRTSKGNYLTVVPNDWHIDESISGTQIAEAEQTSLKDYSAHHYVITKENERKIGLITNNNESFIVESLKQFYSLQGNLLEDSGGRQGPLFGERLPTLQINDRDQWENINCVIVGEEGEDRENWRRKIITVPDRLSLELSDEITDIRSGWYFLRLYDSNLQLVDSCDFRFISSLLKVESNNLNLIPGDIGYSEAEIELIHTSEFQLISDSNSFDEIEVNTLSPEKTKITVKPKPDIDKIPFIVSSKGGRDVKLFIPTERIWWSVNQGESPGAWEDKTINLTPNDFMIGNKSVFIRFPANGWASSMRFGFQNRELRDYPVRLDENFIRVPLSNYSDSEFEMNSFGDHLLWCEIIHDEEVLKLNPFKVVNNAKCKYCDNYESTSIEKIIIHIIENHFELVYREPLYSEIQPHLPHLPKRIYKCAYCPDIEYLKAYSAYPVTEINRHMDEEHSGNLHSFRVVDEVNEIRQIISEEIPSYKKCSLCSKLVPQSECNIHLIREHKKDITLRS